MEVEQRQFTDRSGTRWMVTEKAETARMVPEPRERRTAPRTGQRPVDRGKRLATRTLDLPWLCFESARETRRLSSIPAGWAQLAEDELEDLLADTTLI